MLKKNELDGAERIRVESLLLMEDLSHVEKELLRRKGMKMKDVGMLYVVRLKKKSGERGVREERGLATAEALLRREPRRFLKM